MELLGLSGGMHSLSAVFRVKYVQHKSDKYNLIIFTYVT